MRSETLELLGLSVLSIRADVLLVLIVSVLAKHWNHRRTRRPSRALPRLRQQYHIHPNGG